ncbi:hypothetical protein [Limnohabitans sp. Hippo4]|uniref:hypothetical protein n=1 Tax=Limnohabitans sp. Hippo4 TaxID=1826167 RepID=UPI0013048198|nr:hypothetical protein [Limnohabitans sp. Hippo4]
MKLRWLILILMVLNALFYSWRQGIFESWGFAPDSAREPERTLQQIQPDNVVITRKNP